MLKSIASSPCRAAGPTVLENVLELLDKHTFVRKDLS